MIAKVEPVPVPVSVVAKFETTPLPVTLRVASWAPTDCGVKKTVKVALAKGAKVVALGAPTAKLAFPETATDTFERVTGPTFSTVRVVWVPLK